MDGFDKKIEDRVIDEESRIESARFFKEVLHRLLLISGGDIRKDRDITADSEVGIERDRENRWDTDPLSRLTVLEPETMMAVLFRTGVEKLADRRGDGLEAGRIGRLQGLGARCDLFRRDAPEVSGAEGSAAVTVREGGDGHRPISEGIAVEIRTSGEHLLPREANHVARVSRSVTSLGTRESGCNDVTEEDSLVCCIGSTDRNKVAGWEEVAGERCGRPTSGDRGVHRGNNRTKRGPCSSVTGINISLSGLGGAFAINSEGKTSDLVWLIRMIFQMDLEMKKGRRDSDGHV